jgi:hypothetical protein
VSKSEVELHARLAQLERRIHILLAVMRLLLALVRVSGCRLTGERLPTGKAKADILRAVAAARKTLSLGSTVRVLWGYLYPGTMRGSEPSGPAT